jgi:hypothetical protein
LWAASRGRQLAGNAADDGSLGNAKRKQFFFEKKNQKTVVQWGANRSANRVYLGIKSFLFLFFKKEMLPSSLA